MIEPLSFTNRTNFLTKGAIFSSLFKQLVTNICNTHQELSKQTIDTIQVHKLKQNMPILA